MSTEDDKQNCTRDSRDPFNVNFIEIEMELQRAINLGKPRKISLPDRLFSGFEQSSEWSVYVLRPIPKNIVITNQFPIINPKKQWLEIVYEEDGCIWPISISELAEHGFLLPAEYDLLVPTPPTDPDMDTRSKFITDYANIKNNNYILYFDSRLRTTQYLLSLLSIQPQQLIICECDPCTFFYQYLLITQCRKLNGVKIIFSKINNLVGHFLDPQLYNKYRYNGKEIIKNLAIVYLDFCGSIPADTFHFLNSLKNLQFYAITRGKRNPRHPTFPSMDVDKFPLLTKKSTKHVHTFNQKQIICKCFVVIATESASPIT